MRIVIVGGVAGGMSAATRLRRQDESAHITVLERSGHVSFANCGPPYHVGGVIEDRDSLLLQTPTSLAARFRIDVRVRHEVVEIDRHGQRVRVLDLAAVSDRTSESDRADIWFDYDALILSPGTRPIRPPIPGIERALSLRDVQDTDAINSAITADTRTAVVIGGGFIGVEIAENLVHRGLDVSLVEAAPQVMAPLDPEMAGFVHEQIRSHGVALVLEQSVSAIRPGAVTLSGGDQLAADLVIAAIGMRPDITLAYRAGLKIGDLGGIAVDKRLRTSDPHIYAVGDAVHTHPASQAGYHPGAQTMSLKLLVDPETDAIQWHELEDEVAAGATLLDVGTPEEYACGTIPGAVNIPVDELRDRLGDVPPGRLILTCQVGIREYLAARVLAQHGQDVTNLDGGFQTWAASPAARHVPATT